MNPIRETRSVHSLRLLATTCLLATFVLAPTGTAQSDIQRDTPSRRTATGRQSQPVRGTITTPLFPALRARVDPVPLAVAHADLNGDGRMDFVTSNLANTVSVVLQIELGNYAPAVSYATGGISPSDPQTGDLNRDGFVDVVVVNSDSDSLTILWNDGHGVLTPGSPIATGVSPWGITLGDWDGDGWVDMAVSNVGATDVSIYLNLGGGIFGTGLLYAAGPEPNSIGASDADHDGDLDLVVANYDNAVRIIPNLGDGTFGAPSVFAGGFQPTELVLGDLDRDGWDDIVVKHATPFVTVIRSDGLGGFDAPMSYGVGWFPYDVRLGDMNGNGFLDIATAAHNKVVPSAEITILENDGSGLFPAQRSFFTASAGPLAIFDVERDGDMDVAIVNPSTWHVVLYLNDRNRRFSAMTRSVTEDKPTAITMGDLDGNSRPDLVVTHANLGFSVFLNQGKGRFPTRTTYSGYAVAIGDLNGDGASDLAVSDGNDLLIYSNQGAGVFALPITYDTQSYCRDLLARDLNADGHLDIAICHYIGNKVTVFLNDGNGEFPAAPYSYNTALQPISIDAADLNGDMHPDIVVANASSQSVSVLINAGTGEFFAQVQYFAGPGLVSDVVLGDLNGDGRPDIAVAAGGLETAVLLNFGDGTFAPQVRYQNRAGDLSMLDFDGDGDLDIAASASSIDGVSLLLNRGDGSFGLPIQFAAGQTPSGLVGGDLTGDGKPDLAIVNYDEDSLAILPNVGELRPSSIRR